MIEVDALSRRYGKLLAVDEVSFAISSNEVVGLLGHNGAGKTTVMRMLSGYLEPSAGTVRFQGRDLWTDPHAVQQQLGYLPENLPVYPEMMVADFLDYAAAVKGIGKSERLPAIKEALLATDLTERALDTVATLSRGLKQRVGVAQAILGRPRLLILDEPTNGLDPQQTEQMRALIRRLAKRATVILSTHIMQEVDASCDRVLIMRDGRLVLDQSLAELRNSRTLQLRASAEAEELERHLRRMPQVASVYREPDTGDCEQYTLLLHDASDIDRAASNVAHCVQAAGARLFQLTPVARDLGSVFREANNSER
jgi:ABC-2 type transport system ATP-binding protein